MNVKVRHQMEPQHSLGSINVPLRFKHTEGSIQHLPLSRVHSLISSDKLFLFDRLSPIRAIALSTQRTQSGLRRTNYRFGGSRIKREGAAE